MKRALIGCECSGVIRTAFALRGWEAVSVDLKPSPDTRHGTHIVGDLFEVLERGGWDVFIVHPPCTFLSSSGLHWNRRRPERARQTVAAEEFAVACWLGGLEHAKGVCMENPRGRLGPVMRAQFGVEAQTVQPYQFGDDASKATCLWLYGLPDLRPTRFVEPRWVCCGIQLSESVGRYGCANCNGDGQPLPRWANQTDSGQNRLGPSPDRAARRAQTYPGIAAAMAEQWGTQPEVGA